MEICSRPETHTSVIPAFWSIRKRFECMKYICDKIISLQSLKIRIYISKLELWMKFLVEFLDCVCRRHIDHRSGWFILLGYVLLSKCSRVITRSHPAQIMYHYLCSCVNQHQKSMLRNDLSMRNLYHLSTSELLRSSSPQRIPSDRRGAELAQWRDLGLSRRQCKSNWWN